MREIKFRGQDETGKWFYGSLLAINEKEKVSYALIADNLEADVKDWFHDDIKLTMHKVRRDTLGQYIGLKDKNGKEIYEGDICKAFYRIETPWGCDEYNEVAAVEFCHDFSFGLCYQDQGLDVAIPIEYVRDSGLIEVIGNIHDNPELMKGGVK